MNKMKNGNTPAADIVSDAEIIDRILGGEKDLYAVIVRRYNQRLYKIGMSILNDDAETEDAMQVSYIKAYENLRTFAFKSAFSTWLTKILINECLLRLKQRKKSIRVRAETTETDVDHPRGMETQTPYMKILNAELKVILEKAILNLPEKYRTVFIMREIENMNVAETKDCLAITEANVKVRLNRAKILLRNSLSGYYKNEELLHFHLSRCDRMVGLVMKQIFSL
ncbi:MAG: RNA polymerase sigma factor [Sphingobacteriales bacterium]|nr:RNA polymerase sigma factor [Sphingobacteriales bacterium]